MERWLAEMQRSYKLIARDSYPVPIYGKYDDPPKSIPNWIEVFKFVPAAEKDAGGPVTGGPIALLSHTAKPQEAIQAARKPLVPAAPDSRAIGAAREGSMPGAASVFPRFALNYTAVLSRPGRVSTMRFTKMQGVGNDYIYVDCFAEPMPERPAELARRVSDRHFGIGGDGLILICPSQQADARMRMFNADGSESEMCGNGIRCLAKYLYDHGLCRKRR